STRNALPVRRWQNVQWQIVVRTGLPSVRKRTNPHRQPPRWISDMALPACMNSPAARCPGADEKPELESPGLYTGAACRLAAEPCQARATTAATYADFASE